MMASESSYSENGHAPAPETISAPTLMSLELPPVKWVVPGLLPEGVTLLAGKPKLGKSWLAFGLAIAVASGGVALGSRRVERGESLYLALEDNQRRLQKRLGKLLNGDSAPERLHIATAWRAMDDGGAVSLDSWLTAHPEARLVVIDVLQQVRPRTSHRQSVYEGDYLALQALRSMAAKHSVAVLVIHHLRKAGADDPADEISGSTGLSGAADGFLILRRDRGRGDAYLTVDGRDLEEPAEHALTWNADAATWALAGDADEFRMSRERAAVVAVLEAADDAMTPSELSDALGKTIGSTKKLVWTMSRDGQITSDSGRYCPVTRNPGNPVTEMEETVTAEPEPGNPNGNGQNPHGKGIEDTSGYPVTEVTGRRLTEAEARKVQQLIQSGMEPRLARLEVKGAAEGGQRSAGEGDR